MHYLFLSMFLIYSISFCLFLRIFISLFPWPISSCTLYTFFFSFRALSELITVVLCFQSYNSNIPLIPESTSDARFVSSHCASCLLVSFVIFSLKDQTGVAGTVSCRSFCPSKLCPPYLLACLWFGRLWFASSLYLSGESKNSCWCSVCLALLLTLRME